MKQIQALVIIEDDVPLADSREVAQQLGIAHESFFAIVKKHQQEIEEDFGPIRFEIGLGLPGRGGKQPRYALLTEDQTYAYMSYSQNTAQARTCKRLLVKAFSQARERLR